MTKEGPSQGQRLWLVLRRKVGLRIIADSQHYEGVDKRWRQMADKIIVILEHTYSPPNYWYSAKSSWKCLEFPGYKSYERYLTDGVGGEEVTYTHEGDIYGLDMGEEERWHCCIDSYAGRELFWDGTGWNFEARVAEPKKDDQASMQARCEQRRRKMAETQNQKEAV
jgi:hypothetical protein